MKDRDAEEEKDGSGKRVRTFMRWLVVGNALGTAGAMFVCFAAGKPLPGLFLMVFLLHLRFNAVWLQEEEVDPAWKTKLLVAGNVCVVTASIFVLVRLPIPWSIQTSFEIACSMFMLIGICPVQVVYSATRGFR